MTSGQEFVKRIKPIGCVIFLGACILMLVICFTSGRDPIPGYEPAETMDFYAGDPAALEAELEANVLPHLEGVSDCYTDESGTVTVVLESQSYVTGRSALLKYFDQSLLNIVRLEN